jgi:serine protease Do
VARGRIGVAIQAMDADLAKAFGMDHPRGALVEHVESGSPGDKVAIKSGDVVLAVDGQDVVHAEDLPRMVARHAPGTRVKLTVLHEKQKRDVEVTLAPLEEERQAATESPQGPAAPGDRSSTLGIAVGEENGQVIVERVAPDGPSDGKLKPGDVIEEVARQPVANAADLAAKVKSAPSDAPILLRVKRGEQSRYIAVPRTLH